MLKRLPKLPSSISTALGRIEVKLLTAKKAAKKEALAIYDMEKRTIAIVGGGDSRMRWQAFWHEVAHVALWDAGAHNIMTEQQNEAVVDAIGTFLTQMMLSGQLKLKEKPDDE